MSDTNYDEMAGRKPGHSSQSLVLSVLFATMAAFWILVAVCWPAVFNSWMYEDAFGEWVTFYSFAIAGLTGLVFLGRRFLSKQKSPGARGRLRAWAILLVSVFCLLAAGEEISWGQRLLGMMPPDLFQKLNHQQELNLHNILIYFVSARFVFALICIGYGVVLPVVACCSGDQNRRLTKSWIQVVAPRLVLSPWFAVAGLTYWIEPVTLSLEAAEMLLGQLLLCDVALKCQSTESATRPESRGLALPIGGIAAAMFLGLVNNPIMDRILFTTDVELVAQAQTDLEDIAWDLKNEGAIYPEIAKQNEVYDSRIFNSVHEDMIRFTDQSRFFGARKNTGLNSRETKRRAYFLDPWNNPYWISMKGYGPVQLYSFGPNRRLDTILLHEDRVPGPDELKGDDISLWIDLFRIEP